MTKDELDKYLAHLPARNTRRGGTPPSTLPQTSTSKTQYDSYKNSTRSSFGVRGPRGLSKPTTDLSRRTGTSDNFANDDGTYDCGGGGNKYGPNSNTTNIDTTTGTKYNPDTNITTLMNGMDLNESNNSSSSSVMGGDGDGGSLTDTPRQTNYSAGKHEIECNNDNDAYDESIPPTIITTQQPSRTNQPNEAYKAPVHSTQQEPMPPIPTFSFGSVNTTNNSNNNNDDDDPMPPIPTFSFGNGDDSHQQDNDDDNHDDDKNILNLALGLRCGGCDKLISGMAITAAGHRWHADCFKCQHCHQDLEHVAFYEKDGLPYCALDYHELFTTRCQFCHTPIEEKSIHALGKYYHVGHFFCRECGKPFDEDSTFMEHDGYPYCEKDYLAKFAHKCKGCKEDITNDFLEALDGKWHITCFVCVDCGKAFESNTFYVRNNLPYCERHSRRIKKPA